MKGQANLMEHILLIFFIMVIIVAIILFMTSFQFSQISMEKAKTERDKALAIAKVLVNSQYFVKDDGVFDSGKLTAIKNMADCRELERIFGSNWFLEVKVLDKNEVIIPCSWTNQNCNYWLLSSCGNEGKKNISYVIPVNVYRTGIGRYDIGVATAGVYLK